MADESLVGSGEKELAAIVDELCKEPCWVDRDAEHRGECSDYAGVDMTPPGGWCLPCRARSLVLKLNGGG